MTRRADPLKFNVTKEALLPGMMFAFLVRWCVAAYPYSGYQKPPMYGDFEAQRHWQEITVSTPIDTWYRNTTQNDLNYWGLDYPPLSAYHSYIIGQLADFLEPESVRLFDSRGYEKESHKMFMRWSVFISELYFYVTAVFCLCVDLERIWSKRVKNLCVFRRTDISTVMFLLYPGLILIDHGHFQYNCVSLGLFLWACFFIVAIENDIFSTIFFVLALNFKQMELYHSLPFFFYFLRKSFIKMPSRYRRSLILSSRFNKMAVAVVATFIIIWFPFLKSWDSAYQVIHRMFPLGRGVFEDKVSNVWCFVNVFIKLKNVYSNEEMAKTCLSFTALFAMPSCIDLFIRYNTDKFVLSLINVSLAFFLFSYQVHEKTILLVAIPVALYFQEDPFMCFWFLLVSSFSMLPLLIKDGLFFPFIFTNLIYIFFYSICVKLGSPKSGLFSFFNANKVYNISNPPKKDKGTSMLLSLLSLKFFFSFAGMAWLSFSSYFLQPPAKYPHFFPLLVSVYSCCHFVMFYIYFMYQQFAIPTHIPKPKVRTN